MCGSEDLYKLHANLASILRATGRIEPALEQLRLALGHHPGFFRIYLELAALLREGKVLPARVEEVFVDVAQERPAASGYMLVYRGLLAHGYRRREEGDRLLAAGVRALPEYMDLARLHHEVAVHLAELQAPESAILGFQRALRLRPFQLESFRELIELTGAGKMEIDDLCGWLADRGDAPVWRLYRALGQYQQGLLARDAATQARARRDLEALLPGLSRWRYRGRLRAEALLELGRLCKGMEDTRAAEESWRTLADEPALPEASRAEARALLGGR